MKPPWIILVIATAFLATSVMATDGKLSIGATILRTQDSRCAGRFVSPTMKTKLTVGRRAGISWILPAKVDTYYTLDIYLVNAHGEKLGDVLDWNWVKFKPTSDATWDTRVIYADSGKRLRVSPGKYKLLFSYSISDDHPELNSAGCSRDGSFESDVFEIGR